jgi:hypothetical protein
VPDQPVSKPAQKIVGSSRTPHCRKTSGQKSDLLVVSLTWARRIKMDSTHISALHAKHAGLDERLKTESARPMPDSILIAMLKKQKLAIKEEIQNLNPI